MNRTDETSRKKPQAISLSPEDRALLDRVAAKAYESNRSLAVRMMTNEKARALGLLPAVNEQPQAVA